MADVQKKKGPDKTSGKSKPDDVSQKTSTTKTDVEPTPEFEDRIDEYAIDQFKALGLKGRLPDGYVYLYKQYKLTKDRLRPGPLSPEAIALIVTLADVASGKIAIPGA